MNFLAVILSIAEMSSAKGSRKGSQDFPGDGGSGGPQRGGPGVLGGPSMSVEYDTDQEQQLPMMPQPAEPPPDQQPQFKMASENPAPTGFLAWAGFGCSIFALACLCIAFASPYWMQTYPNSFNNFQNLGLWEICMDHYMHHKDDSQEIYSGCWWVFNREERYWKLRDWLLPRKYIFELKLTLI